MTQRLCEECTKRMHASLKIVNGNLTVPPFECCQECYDTFVKPYSLKGHSISFENPEEYWKNKVKK
jgi:hypothetical protein